MVKRLSAAKCFNVGVICSFLIDWNRDVFQEKRIMERGPGSAIPMAVAIGSLLFVQVLSRSQCCPGKVLHKLYMQNFKQECENIQEFLLDTSIKSIHFLVYLHNP